MGCATPPIAGTLDQDTSAWLRDLAANGYRRETALVRLHALLLRAARREATRRAPASPVSGVEFADVAQQAADDALVAIVAKLGEFRGESRFTTWAYKFVVLEVASKLTRHAWRTKPAIAQVEEWETLPDRFGLTPQEALEQRELLAAIRDAVQVALSERQRKVFVALVLNGVPLDVLAAETGSNRNALYKVLFDARRKVRAHLVANGYTEYE
jgi:RNA polymerase sigma-70 factor, ECF subfamily